MNSNVVQNNAYGAKLPASVGENKNHGPRVIEDEISNI